MLMYRYKGEALEVYMEKGSDNKWSIPKNFIKSLEDELNESLQEYSESMAFQKEEDYILLDPIANETGELEHIVALEDNSSDSPNENSYFFPELKEGKFFECKEALKSVMPKQYKLIKELHEILEVRNIIKNI